MSDKRFPANIISSTPVEPTGSFEDSLASGTWSLQEAFTYVKAGLWPTAGNQKPLIEDVFSTYLFPSTSGTDNQIVNDIDLSGEGGMVWVKSRTTGSTNNYIIDTVRGSASGDSKKLVTNTTAAQDTGANLDYMVFNSDGFTSKAVVGGGELGTNTYYGDFASWTFRKAPRFFDVVTYTGTGANRTVAHNLGVEPGCILIKETTATRNWYVYHRSTGNTQYLNLNLTNAAATASTAFNNTSPTDTEFTVGTINGINNSGSTYVAYLFAHDPLGPSEDGSDGLIACGSYTGDGTTDGSNQVTLGWEPQWLLVKNASSASGWVLVDNMRGFSVDQGNAFLSAQSPNAEVAASTTYAYFGPKPDGFVVSPTTTTGMNASGQTYIYIAIRRGPMRAPTSGTEVFALDTQNSGSYSSPPYYRSGFVTDAALRLYRTGGSSAYQWFASRMTGGNNLVTSSTAAEVTNASTNQWDYMNGWGGSGASGSTTVVVSPMFRRAPGFFDVVAYTGDGVAGRTVPHNLGVAPEMMIVKSRSGARNWGVYHTGLNGSSSPEGYSILLNSTNAEFSSPTLWNNTAPTDVVFTLGTNNTVNQSGATNIAYLFATLPGVSKVGSYTGNGTSQTIDCGFTSGARFVLIKRTDSTGDWYVWDTARGIVTGNDPHLSLNTTAAEVTTDDSVDAESSGFIVNQDAATNVNVDTASYIFLAIA